MALQAALPCTQPDLANQLLHVAVARRHETVQTARHILQELGSGRLTAELLQPNELVTGMLLQVGSARGAAPSLPGGPCCPQHRAMTAPASGPSAAAAWHCSLPSGEACVISVPAGTAVGNGGSWGWEAGLAGATSLLPPPLSHWAPSTPPHPAPAQVANEPGLAPALSELVDNTQGNEVYLRRPERYSLDSQSSTAFAEVGG